MAAADSSSNNNSNSNNGDTAKQGGTRQVPIVCPGHTRPLAELQFLYVADEDRTFLVSACHGTDELRLSLFEVNCLKLFRRVCLLKIEFGFV